MIGVTIMSGGANFLRLRDQLMAGAPATVHAPDAISWPPGLPFNWALDYFDRIAAGNERPALRVVDDAGGDAALSFAALSARSSQVANFLASLGVGRGDRVLIMLGNVVPLWETMLATIKLGAVMIPATTLLQSRGPARPARSRAGPRHRHRRIAGGALCRPAGRADPRRDRRRAGRLDRLRGQRRRRHDLPARRRDAGG